MGDLDVEWVANQDKRSVLLKFNSNMVWDKFVSSFKEFLDDEGVDEFGRCDCGGSHDE